MPCKNMKKTSIILIVLLLMLIIAAAIFVYERAHVSLLELESSTNEGITLSADEIGGNDKLTYTSITMDEAKEVFTASKQTGDYIILDVRRADEFAEGHIPGAINIANEDIGIVELAELPDKNQTIYVYCRSGNRSKQAADKLVQLGYTNIIEFGGIIDWTGAVAR